MTVTSPGIASPSPGHPTANLSLEERIFRRLSEWQRRYPDGNGPRDPELEGLIYDFLYSNLRCVATVLPGMGWQAVDKRRDVTCRFTSVLNTAFLRIIDKYPTRLMQATSRSQLTGFVSKTMVNLLFSHERRQTTWKKIAERLGLTEAEDLQVRDILSHLADERRGYFEQRTSVQFAEGLEVIQSWDNSDQPDQQQYACVLRKRYIDQLSYDQIAAEMQLSKTTVENLLERAKYHLRKMCRSGVK